MSISPAAVLDILFIPLTSLVLTFATRAFDSYEDAKSEKNIHGYFLYGIFIFINVYYFLTNNRYFRVQCLLKRTLLKTKGIHAKCVTTLGNIQGFLYEAYENLFRFYVQSIAMFTAHCYPIIFILIVQPDGLITKLLGALFTTLLLFESIDSGDRLLRIVRLASYIIYVCICGALIASQLYEYLLYTILTVLFVACWTLRPNRRPIYSIFNFINRNSEEVEFEPVQKVHIAEQRVWLVENEEATEQLDVGFRCEIHEPDEFKLMEVDSQLPQQVKRPIEYNQMMHGELLRMPIDPDQFNQGIYHELAEPPWCFDEQINSEKIEAEQLNKVLAIVPLELKDFNQEKYGVYIEPYNPNRGIDRELIENEQMKQGIDREIIETEHLKQGIDHEVIETEHLKQGIDRELIETERLNKGIGREQIETDQLKQGIDRMQIELDQLKQGIDREQMELEQLKQGIDREQIELEQLKQGFDRELIEPEQFNKGIYREPIKPHHFNQDMGCVPIEPNLNQGTYNVQIEPEQLNHEKCLVLIKTQQFNKDIDGVPNESENLNQEIYHESKEPDNLNQAKNRMAIDTKQLNQGVYRDPLVETEQLDTRQRIKIDQLVHILRIKPSESDKLHLKAIGPEPVHTNLILSEAVHNDLRVLEQTTEGPLHKLEERIQQDQTDVTPKASAFVEYDPENFKHDTQEQNEFTRKHFNHHRIHRNIAAECIESSPNPTDTEINTVSASSSCEKTHSESIYIQSSNPQTLKRKNPKINITDLIRFYERSDKRKRTQIVDDDSERNSNCTLGAEYGNYPNVCTTSRAILQLPYYTLSKDLDSMPIMNSNIKEQMPILPLQKTPTVDPSSNWRSRIEQRINIGYNNFIGFNFVAKNEELVSDSLSNDGTKNNSDNFPNVVRETAAKPCEGNVQNGSSTERKIVCLNTLKPESHESEVKDAHKENSEIDRTINMESMKGERPNLDCMQIYKKILKEYLILNESRIDSSDFPAETSGGLKDSQAEKKERVNREPPQVEQRNLYIDSSCRDTPEEELNLNPNTSTNKNGRMNLECIKGIELGNAESPKQSNSIGVPNTLDMLQVVETCVYDTSIRDSSQTYNPDSSTESTVTGLSLFSENEMKAMVSGNEVENDDVSKAVDSDKETCLMQNEENQNSELFEASSVDNVVNEIDPRFIYSVS